jgi:cell division protein FtsI/penicillin-binding protein 2
MPKNARKTRKKNPMKTVFTRFMLIVAFFILWIGGIGARLVHLQITQHEELFGKAMKQRRDKVEEKQLRGTIYDRSNRALAMSSNVKTLYADSAEISDVETTAKALAKVLNLKAVEISANLKAAKEKNNRFVVLARKLEDEAVQRINEGLKDEAVKKADLPKFTGLHWKEEQKRSYPQKTLAAQVIGFSNAQDVGSAGIEQSQEKNLRGAVIEGWEDRDRFGRVYNESSETEERDPPKDIHLTLSYSIQYKVEQALEQGVKAANAKSGMAIVMIPRTGEILAMANYPTFDPNKYNEFPPDFFTNKAIHEIHSPGSVFKTITYSAAINEGEINPNGEVDCGNGVLKIPGREIVDKHCRQKISYTDAMAVSSNIAAMKTGMAVRRERFHFYVQRFGFGSPLGIELPAETGGILRAPEKWSGDSLASMSIGYEIGVSALQMTAAFATIANDGIRVQPHIIKEIKNADGSVFSTTEPNKTQVVSVETARSLRKMMRQVVLTGTGKRAQLNGYTSAGKTGTAWKYDATLKAINSNKYVSSFIGFAPAENPEVVIAVILDEPKVGARDGGQVSAPVFRDIAEQILPELNVVPDANIRQDAFTAEEIPSETENVPTDKKAKTEAVKNAKNAKDEKPKDLKEPKKENTTPDKKGTKPKTNALNSEIRNKSSGKEKKT